MKNDLISRSELKKEFEKVYPLAVNDMGGVVNKDIYDIINKVPAVKFSLFPADESKDEAYMRGYKHGVVEGILKGNTRPQGEWIELNERIGIGEDNIYTSFKCPFCGYIDLLNNNFCGNCGTKMIANKRGNNE